MAQQANQGSAGTGLSESDLDNSADASAAEAALLDDFNFEDGDEVESEYESKDEEATKSEDDATDDEDPEESDDADETTDEDDSENDQAEDDKDEADESATDLEAERKRHDDEMAKARIEERKAHEETARVKKEQEDATIERYLKDAGDDEAERARREQNVELYKIRQERIALTDELLTNESIRARRQIDLFTTGSSIVQEELNQAADEFEDRFVERDEQGNPLRIKIDPKTGKRADLVAFLQAKADRIKQIQGEGKSQQEKSKKKEQARSLTPPVRAPKKEKEDPLMAGFDEEAARR